MSNAESTAVQSTSLWAAKPRWCQPWSIVLTGFLVPVASWLLLHRVWVTAPVVGAVLLWWWLFLVIGPAAYHQALVDAQSTDQATAP